MRWLLILFALTACGEVAYNTRVADSPPTRQAMRDSVTLGYTTAGAHIARWGAPTQRIREGGQISFVYRNMRNPLLRLPVPQYGKSDQFAVVVFQYGVAAAVYTSDSQGCRGTFPQRPPGPGLPNPGTVRPVNCGDLTDYIDSDGEEGRIPMEDGAMLPDGTMLVPGDVYGGKGTK